MLLKSYSFLCEEESHIVCLPNLLLSRMLIRIFILIDFHCRIQTGVKIRLNCTKHFFWSCIPLTLFPVNITSRLSKLCCNISEGWVQQVPPDLIKWYTVVSRDVTHTQKHMLRYVHVVMLAQGTGWGSFGLDTRVSTTTPGMSALGSVVTTWSQDLFNI